MVTLGLTAEKGHFTVGWGYIKNFIIAVIYLAEWGDVYPIVCAWRLKDTLREWVIS